MKTGGEALLNYFLDKWSNILSVDATPESALDVPSVWACIDAISSSVGATPINLKVKKYKGEKQIIEDADDHPMQRLIKNNPNPLQTPIVVIQSIVANAALYGDGYIEIATNDAGRKFLNPISDSRRVDITKDSSGKVVYKVAPPIDEIAGSTRILKPSQIIHLRWLTLGSVKALNAFRHLKSTLILALSAIGFGIANIRDGNHSKLALIHKTPPATKDGRDQIRKDLKDGYSGLKSAAQGAMYIPGDFSLTQIKDTLLDSQYVQLDTMLDEKVARFFGVQQHVIGLLSRSTNNNIESQNISFLQKTLLPWYIRLEQELNSKLLTEDERKTYFFKFSLDGMLRGNTLARYQAHQIAITNGILSPNEVRELEDRNPREDGEGDKFLTPLNMSQSGDVRNQEIKDED